MDVDPSDTLAEAMAEAADIEKEANIRAARMATGEVGWLLSVRHMRAALSMLDKLGYMVVRKSDAT